MQRRVVLGAGAAIVVVIALAGLKLAGQHEAAKVLNKDIDQIAATLPPGYAATHGATDVNPITGSVTIHDLAVSLGGKPLWSAETLTVTGADQQALRDVFDPGAYRNGHPAWTTPRLLIADASATGVRIPADGPPAGEVSIRSIALHQLRGRPFQTPPTRDQVTSRAFRADAALAFAVQSLDVHGFLARAQAPKPTSFTIGSIILRDYDGGRIGRAAVTKLALDASADKPTPVVIHATLDSIEIKDLNAVAPLEKLQLDEPADRSTLTGLRDAGLIVSGLYVDVSPGPRITLASLEAHGSSDTSGPNTGEATLRGLTLALKDTPLAPGPAALIAAFGMNAVTMDVASKTSTDAAAKVSKIVEDVALHDLGTLHFSLAAGLKFPADPNQDPQAALMTTPIDHATIEWHDQGLVSRALDAAAMQMHTTPDVVRAQLAMPLLTLGFLMPDQPDVADQLTAFVNHPGTLIVTLDPPQPVTFAEVGKAPAETRAHLLGAHIQAN